MQLEPLFQNSLNSEREKTRKFGKVRSWVAKAIAEEELKPNTQLWRNEPTPESQNKERLRRIRFLCKHVKSDPSLQVIIDQLERCEKRNRCCSGACSECGRLIQRWFVRKSQRVIGDEIEKPDQQLVAISIIPPAPIIRPGKLHTLSIANMQRRLKYAFDNVGLNISIGGIDFSFNEDSEGEYQPFWCPHFYLIVSTTNRKQLRCALKQIFKSNMRIPRPIKISDFNNSARRRSYAYKINFWRRIGTETVKIQRDGTSRKCRNTSKDKLRAAERLELFAYLHQMGFGQRFLFRGCKAVIKSNGVTVVKV